MIPSSRLGQLVFFARSDFAFAMSPSDSKRSLKINRAWLSLFFRMLSAKLSRFRIESMKYDKKHEIELGAQVTRCTWPIQ